MATATVIDAFVIQLGLDPSNLSEGQRKAIQGLQNFRRNIATAAQHVEREGSNITGALSKVHTATVSLFTALAGTATLKGFITSIVEADASTARLAQRLNVSASSLSGWQSAGRAAGGTAAGVAHAFGNLNTQLQEFQFTGVPPESFRWLNTLGIQAPIVNGKVGDVTKTFIKMAEVMKSPAYNYDIAKQQIMLAHVFGDQAGELTNIIIAADRAGMSVQQYMEHVKAVTGVTDESIDAHNRWLYLWGELELKIEGIGRKIETAFRPQIEGAFKSFFDLLERTNAELDVISKNGFWALFKDFFSMGENFGVKKGSILDIVLKAMGIDTTKLNATAEAQGMVQGQSTGVEGYRLPPGGTQGPPPSAAVRDRIAAAKAAMMDQARKEGVPEEHVEAAASAMIGQALSESQLDPNTLHDRDPTTGQPTGYGIYGARLERRDKMLEWLRKNKFADNSLEGQAREMMHRGLEMPEVGDALRKATKDNAWAVNRILTDKFESPKVRNYGDRMQNTIRGFDTPIPNVDAGARAGAVNSDTINNTNNANDNSRSTKVDIHSMNITTPNAQDFAMQMQPILEGNRRAAMSNSALA